MLRATERKQLKARAHGLIKVRAPDLEREVREDALKALCERTGAESVQAIGKVFVIYRKRDE
jgi:RNA-binding protein